MGNQNFNDSSEVIVKIDEVIAQCNKAIDEKNFEAYNANMLALDELKSAYATLRAKEVYADLAQEEEPIISAIKMYSFEVVRIKEVKDKETHAVISIERDVKSKQIDLLKFCKQAELDTMWQYDVEACNQLLALRCAKSLGYTTTQIEQMSKSYFMQTQARKIKMGETPTSNTKVCKMLQEVIDKIMPNTDENGKSILKVNSHDVAYLDNCYAKKGREQLTIALAKHDFLRRLIMDIMYRLLTDAKYSVEYKAIK